MPSHEENRILPFAPEQMFAIVADIERYPEFVPGCDALRIVDYQKVGEIKRLTAEMVVSFQVLRERYTSSVTLDPEHGKIEAHHLKGPFHHLDTVWRFAPHAGGSEVNFRIDFAFKNPILSAASRLVFDKMARKMADAFVARAQAMYGASQHVQQ